MLAAGAGLAAAVAAAVAVLAGAWPYTVLGNSDPGALVRIGTPLLRLVADGSATLCVGSLVFAACFTARQDTGGLSAVGYAAVRSAGRWAVLWFLAAAVMVPFTVANLSGQPLAGRPQVHIGSPTSQFELWTSLEQPVAWLVTAGAAPVVALACRTLLRWQPTVAVLGLAVFGVLPPLVTGHSSSDTGHDLGTAAILIHVPVAVVWVGVLVALLRPGWRRAVPLPQVMRRYRWLALACWLILAASGLVDAWVLVPAGQLLSTGYGRLLLVKIGLVAAVGLLGWWLRRRASVPGASAARLVVGEFVVLAATLGASVGLDHLVPPSFIGHPVTPDQTLLGYNLAGPPTLLRLVADWRIEVLFGSLAVALAVPYLLGVRRLRRQGRRWPAGRTAVWLAGCVVLLIATCSGIGRYASAMFSVHMAAHMLIGMLVPLLLALGGPLTLVREALPPAEPGGLAGPREWLGTLGNSPLLRLLTHPIVALGIFAGAPFLLYFTSLFDAAARFHWAHIAVNACFLVIGYLFAWAAVGVDPPPRPMPNLARLGMLLAAMPFDIVFGAMVMTTGRVIGNGPAGANMYSALALPWVPSLLADQHLAGGIALAIGEVTLLAAMAALLLRWNRIDAAEGSGLGDYTELLAGASRRAR